MAALFLISWSVSKIVLNDELAIKKRYFIIYNQMLLSKRSKSFTQNCGQLFVDDQIDVAQLELELNCVPLVIQQPNWHTILQFDSVIYLKNHI